MPRTNRSIAITLSVFSVIFLAYTVWFGGIVNYRKMTPTHRQWSIVAGIVCPLLALGFALAARRWWRLASAERG